MEKCSTLYYHPYKCGFVFIKWLYTHRKLRSSDHGQLLLNLCAGLLGLYITFIFAVHSSSVPPLCAIVSIMLQYFMLVVFMIMAAEAINLYLKLVVVLGYTITHYSMKAAVICWGKYSSV